MADELQNVTITVDKGTLKKARTKAAESNMSLSRYVGEVLRERLGHDEEYERAMRRFFASDITIDTKKYGRPYTREELNDRAFMRKEHEAALRAEQEANERARIRRR